MHQRPFLAGVGLLGGGAAAGVVLLLCHLVTGQPSSLAIAALLILCGALAFTLISYLTWYQVLRRLQAARSRVTQQLAQGHLAVARNELLDPEGELHRVLLPLRTTFAQFQRVLGG